MNLLFVYTWVCAVVMLTLFLLLLGFFEAGYPWYVGVCTGWCVGSVARALADWVTEEV